MQTRIDPLGNRYTAVFDSQNRLTAALDPLGDRTSVAYNAANLVTQITNPLGNISSNVYDNLQRLVATIDPLGNRSTYNFDNAGNADLSHQSSGSGLLDVFDSAAAGRQRSIPWEIPSASAMTRRTDG